MIDFTFSLLCFALFVLALWAIDLRLIEDKVVTYDDLIDEHHQALLDEQDEVVLDTAYLALLDEYQYAARDADWGRDV